MDSLFGGGEVEVPATTQAVIDALKDSLEDAVKRGISRMDVDLPLGLRLGGIEGVLDPLSTPEGDLPKDRVARGDRDLARYFARLLKPVESKLCTVFRTASLVKAAQPVWKASGTGGRLLAYGNSKSKKRGAFGSDTANAEAFRQSLRDVDCGHVVFVSPRAKQLRMVAELDKEDREGKTCIVLLNSRLRGPDQKGDELRQELALSFTPVFHLSLMDGDGMVFKALRDGGTTPWVIAQRQIEVVEQSETFVAKEVLRSDMEPPRERIVAALSEAR